MRILAIFILIGSALLTPFWMFVLISIVYALIFMSPYEIVVVSACIDAVYGGASTGFGFLYTLAAILIFIGMTFLRPYLIFHE